MIHGRLHLSERKYVYTRGSFVFLKDIGRPGWKDKRAPERSARNEGKGSPATLQ